MENSSVTNAPPSPNNDPCEAQWRETLTSLIEHSRGRFDRGDFAACKRLTPQLIAAAGVKVSWTPNYVLGVLHSNMLPSPVFTEAVERLAKRRRRKHRRDKLRVYVPVASEAERDYINRILSAEDKRDALLVAALFEEH